ncbi:hypothetical protein HMI49_21470 [Corallococcus exercitus]|uniref:Uncharacterized protein n=1 Tax=Corallococcus exercitus TaxID=2316736 RepID=A0A7Y4KL20_9BACT|nr:hypothetical protein [Corallococcus exercitus]NOK35773.1 hypothetical protein [Corallococcus exercitus]
MERVQGGGVRSGSEVRSELERAQVELSAARRKVQELEQVLAARSREASKWEARALKEPRPDSEFRLVAFAVGLMLGGLLLQGAVTLAGGWMPPPASSAASTPNGDNRLPLNLPYP